MGPARLEARMDSLLSFPVGLFHPLQHAGLSRRSPSTPQLGRNLRPSIARALRRPVLRVADFTSRCLLSWASTLFAGRVTDRVLARSHYTARDELLLESGLPGRMRLPQGDAASSYVDRIRCNYFDGTAFRL